MASRTNPDILTVEALQAGLRTQRLGRTLRLFDEVDSTNLVATEMAQRGADHGTVVVAERQTAGKGRLGRSWFSPAGEGLYCSILLRSEYSRSLPDRLTWIPLISAMATARAIDQTTGLAVRLKWPNDVLLGERKVGGLLCESGGRASGPSHAVGHPGYVIVGIGLNVNIETFPEDLRDVATSLAIAAGRPVDRTRLLTALLNELEMTIESLSTASDLDLVRSYTAVCATLGRRVKLELAGNESLTGWAQAIGPDGSLRVIRDGPQADSMVAVRAGEVVHVR
jgi:BirA family transcriptional regulator, biotin operon repressor / biotin---[acetyl-CoA-carboxylase] ligase